MATKTIYIVRHGQYKKEPSEVLTPLGRKQAKLAGRRLKEIKFDEIHFSTMPRAEETAQIICATMGSKRKPKGSDFLHECVPGFPKNLRKKYGFTDERRLKKDIRQANRAYRDLFTFPKKDQNVLVVCHGNIIRYLMCKALGIDTENWRKFDIKQCGISVIELNAKKHEIYVISHNDVGHIPMKMQTFI